MSDDTPPPAAPATDPISALVATLNAVSSYRDLEAPRSRGPKTRAKPPAAPAKPRKPRAKAKPTQDTDAPAFAPSEDELQAFRAHLNLDEFGPALSEAAAQKPPEDPHHKLGRQAPDCLKKAMAALGRARTAADLDRARDLAAGPSMQDVDWR